MPAALVDIAKAGESSRLRIDGRRTAAQRMDRCRLTAERFFVDRPNLDGGAVVKPGVLRHQLDRVVHVAGLQDDNAPKLHLRFGKRTVDLACSRLTKK
jgi:hypothetical protein